MEDSEDVSEGSLSDQELLDGEAKSVRGRPKCGRPWKTVKERYSSMVKVKPLKSSWETKMKLKRDRKMVMTHEKELKDEKKKEKEEARNRILERKKREEDNARRAEIVQPIKNTAKIRRMKRKQLRLLEKR